MKAAIYCRVSTEDQEKEGTSLDSQLEACLRKAKELGYDVPQELIFKETYSGLSLDRPQLTTLRSKARNREIAAIIVYTPDRLCRVGEDILTLAKEFKLYGVRLAFVKEQEGEVLLRGVAGVEKFSLVGSMEFGALSIPEPPLCRRLEPRPHSALSLRW